MTFGERLKKIRDDRGWPQWRLAKELGIEQATISRLENDEWEPSGPTQRLIGIIEAEAVLSTQAETSVRADKSDEAA